MLAVDRGKYSKNNPYMDAPQGIGYGVTISAPHMVIFDGPVASLLQVVFKY